LSLIIQSSGASTSAWSAWAALRLKALHAPPNSAVRAAWRGNLLVSGAMDQRGDNVVDDDAIRHAAAVTP
jgi:hypothetical protein